MSAARIAADRCCAVNEGRTRVFGTSFRAVLVGAACYTSPRFARPNGSVAEVSSGNLSGCWVRPQDGRSASIERDPFAEGARRCQLSSAYHFPLSERARRMKNGSDRSGLGFAAGIIFPQPSVSSAISISKSTSLGGATGTSVNLKITSTSP
jgi:hypothetical protein